ncbi:unnamed protein product [Ixodes persulcatus]
MRGPMPPPGVAIKIGSEHSERLDGELGLRPKEYVPPTRYMLAAMPPPVQRSPWVDSGGPRPRQQRERGPTPDPRVARPLQSSPSGAGSLCRCRNRRRRSYQR